MASKRNKPTANPHVQACKLIERIEREFRGGAEDAHDARAAVYAQRRTDTATELLCELSPRITVCWPGLYPAFKVDGGVPIPALTSAYEEVLGETERGKFRHWRALFHTVKRGARLDLLHAGDRHKLRVLIARTHGVSDLTWHIAHAVGVRYSERTRMMMTNNVDGVMELLYAALFGKWHSVRDDVEITWGWL